MDAVDRQSAESIRALIADADAELSPATFRATLTSVAASDRDAWLNLVLGLDEIADDGPDLPRGCLPYLPCSVETVLQIAEHAGVRPSDVFVDIGSGVGRAAALMHLVTGAAAIGLEIQPALVEASRELALRLRTRRVNVVGGDAAHTAGLMVIGSVFFLYCPFGGDRLDKVLDDLEAIARARTIHVCCLDLPLPRRAWLTLTAQPSEGLSIYRSTLR